MLHAITHRKTRQYQRYLGHRDDSEKRVPEEDEITSLIMGPLDFLPSSAIGVFWMNLVKWGNPEVEFPAGAVTEAKMSFWPRKGRIEPDLCVDLSWGEEHRLLLVEFKWRAGLSGPNQLHKQWQEYLSQDERERAWHIFIAPSTSEGSNALSREDVWKGKLLLRSWFDVLNTLHALSGPDAQPLQRWSSEVCRCLDKLGIRPFRGFNRLSVPEVPQLQVPAFWRGFDGFAHLARPEQFPANISHHVFFSVAGGHCV